MHHKRSERCTTLQYFLNDRAMDTMLGVMLLLCVCVPRLVLGYTDLDSDKLNYDEETRNRADLKRHIDCYLDRQPCSDDEQRYKNHALDAVANLCRFCSPREKHFGHILFDRMEKEFPEDYKEFVKKYDPDGKNLKIIRNDVNKY